MEYCRKSQLFQTISIDTQRVHFRPNWIWLQTDWCCNMSQMYVEIWSKWISKDSVKSKRCHSGASQADYLVSCQFMGSILDTEYNSHGNRIDPTLLIKNGKNLFFSVPPTLEGWEGRSRAGCQRSLVLELPPVDVEWWFVAWELSTCFSPFWSKRMVNAGKTLKKAKERARAPSRGRWIVIRGVSARHKFFTILAKDHKCWMQA